MAAGGHLYGANLLGAELDLCLEFVAPSYHLSGIGLELGEGDVRRETNVLEVVHNGMVRPSDLMPAAGRWPISSMLMGASGAMIHDGFLGYSHELRELKLSGRSVVTVNHVKKGLTSDHMETSDDACTQCGYGSVCV